MGPDFDCDYRGQGQDHQVRRSQDSHWERFAFLGEGRDLRCPSRLCCPVSQEDDGVGLRSEQGIRAIRPTRFLDRHLWLFAYEHASELSGLLACEQEPATIRLLDSLRGYSLAGSLTGRSSGQLAG